MKICVLCSSYEESSSILTTVDKYYPDPSRYVTEAQSGITFTQKLVTKANALEGIQEIISEGYDYIWNFLWGSESDDVAGVQAIKALEATNHPMIGHSSKFITLSKLDLKKAAQLSNGSFNTPKWAIFYNDGSDGAEDDDELSNLDLSGMIYPLIVKPAFSVASVLMNRNSVVHTEDELKEQIRLLKDKTGDIMIEEYIIGNEVSVMVLENLQGTTALHPLIYKFPEELTETEKWLDFDAKFEGSETGRITHHLWDEYTANSGWDKDEAARMQEKIQQAGISAFESLGVHGSGYARVDLRIRDGDVYVLEVNADPAFFYHIGNTYGDDFVIEKTYPGGHAALVNTIIETRKQIDSPTTFYNKFAPSYDQLATKSPRTEMNLYDVWNEIAELHPFYGKVLDLGSGTGALARIIGGKYPSVAFTGIDLSPEMSAQAREMYQKIHIGHMENVLMDMDKEEKFDHVVANGVIPYLSPSHFNLVLTRAFDLAQNSIILTIEDTSENYRVQFYEKTNCQCFNHAKTIQKFKPPVGWKLEWERYDFLWMSPTTFENISGITVCFKKMQKDDE